MSYPCIASEPYEIIVGWDPPLQTYFLQIIDPAKSEEEEPTLWIGAAPRELPTIASLASALATYAILPEDLTQKLEAEKAESFPPSPLQRLMIEMVASAGKIQCEGCGSYDGDPYVVLGTGDPALSGR